ncbi:MAG: class I SAM-dependent DNA methyltransferase, partial [Rhodospirillales bacterium]
ISSEMIAEAEKKQLYDSLHIAENVAYLEQSDDREPFNFICAADVFVYVGSLEATFAAAHSRLAPSGAFAFSIETLEEGTYALHRTGRYAHHGEYIKTLAVATGFSVQHCQEIIVRQDGGVPIAGLLFVLIRE